MKSGDKLAVQARDRGRFEIHDRPRRMKESRREEREMVDEEINKLQYYECQAVRTEGPDFRG